MGLGGPELLIVLAIVLLLFGTTRLPKLARSFGEAQRELKAGQEHQPEPVTVPVNGTQAQVVAVPVDDVR